MHKQTAEQLERALAREPGRVVVAMETGPAHGVYLGPSRLEYRAPESVDPARGLAVAYMGLVHLDGEDAPIRVALERVVDSEAEARALVPEPMRPIVAGPATMSGSDTYRRAS